MDQIRKRIEQAFPVDGIPVAPIIDTYDDEGIVPTFLGRSWNSFATRELREHSAAISFLTESAFIYYLPAFLVATIDDPETADIIPDNLLTKFARPRAAAIVARLTPEQRSVVVEFFSACLGDDPCYARELADAMDRLTVGIG